MNHIYKLHLSQKLYNLLCLSSTIHHSITCTVYSPIALAQLTLPFAYGDPAPILCTLLCVKVSDAERGEILLRR